MQVGIESLSTSLLRRLIYKGTSALQNIQIMRWMDEVGIRHVGNIILNYPGASADDLRETLYNLQFVTGFQPLRGGRFSLGYFSPIWRRPEIFGLHNIRNHESFNACLPDDLRPRLRSLELDFESEVTPEVEDLWNEIAIRIAIWGLQFRDVCASTGLRSLVVFDDDGECLRIEDWRDGARKLSFLDGWKRRFYLNATAATDLRTLVATDVAQEDRDHFWDELVSQRLVFREGNKVLALAVHRQAAAWPDHLRNSGRFASISWGDEKHLLRGAGKVD
jgi:hypothetical protein